jgi:hypothetical protein
MASPPLVLYDDGVHNQFFFLSFFPLGHTIYRKRGHFTTANFWICFALWKALERKIHPIWASQH